MGNEDSNGYLGDFWMFNVNTTLWTWLQGSSMASGMEIVGSPNVPLNRAFAMTWKDTSGNFWLYGGVGPVGKDFNILFKSVDVYSDFWIFNYNCSSWVLVMAGLLNDNASPQGNAARGPAGPPPMMPQIQPPNYGQIGMPSPTNTPGGRQAGGTWMLSNEFYIFAGIGAGGNPLRGNQINVVTYM